MKRDQLNEERDTRLRNEEITRQIQTGEREERFQDKFLGKMGEDEDY